MLNQIVYEAVPVLTATPFQPILASLSNMKVGTANPKISRLLKPLSNVVFLCHSKIKSDTVSFLNSVMAGLLGNSKELPFLCTVFCRLFQSCHLCTANHSGGLNPQYKGHTAMNTSTGEIRPTIPQDLTQLKQAYFALTGAFSYLFTVDGADKQNNALSYDLVIDSAQHLINQAQLLKNTRA